MKVSELLYCQKDNPKCAIKYKNVSLSYMDWHCAALSISRIIDRYILEDSITIASYLPNSINYSIAYFAAQYSNKIFVPIYSNATELEILSTISYCETDFIITDSDHFDYIEKCIRSYDKKVFILNIDEKSVTEINSFHKCICKSERLKEALDKNVALMLHTSGTTSSPKRVMLTHYNLISNIRSNVQSLGLTSQEKTLISLPMIFGYCNTSQFLTNVYLGATIVIYDGIFSAKKFFEIVQKEQITNYTCVPSILLLILSYKYSHRYNYASLRQICFGGGIMPVDKLQELIFRFPSIGFVQTYGQTEASPRVTALLPGEALRKIGSVGTPIPGVKVKIVDGNVELSPGKIGEILIKGDNVMIGYYKQEELSKKTIKNGWLYSGDLGYKDEEGFLFLVGRKKNIIISGGINIYPEEVEEVILSHHKVMEVMVKGEPDDMYGEIPIAYVVVEEGFSIDDIKKFCESKLSSYKVPKKFIIVNELKKTITGKVSRSGDVK